jgi:hypothetical protein
MINGTKAQGRKGAAVSELTELVLPLSRCTFEPSIYE